MKPSPFRRFVFALFVLAVLYPRPLRAQTAAPPPPLGGDARLEQIPEHAGLRRDVWEGFLAAPRSRVLSLAPRVLRNEYGEWRLSVAAGKDAFYLIIAPRKGGDFPVYGQGAWIVKRAAADGRFLQAKIFLRSDPGCFLRIYPDGDRSTMDVAVYGGAINKGVPLPVPFERVLRASIAEIVAWSRDSVEWSLFSPRSGLYDDSRRLVAALRERLPSLAYAEDGALDTEGRPIYIATGAPQTGKPGLNCSGFVKWIADGIRGPRPAANGLWLDPRAMAARHEELRGSSFSQAFERVLDPYFGLDWTRNLAKALMDARIPSRSHAIGEADVKISAFSLYNTNIDPVNGGSPHEAYPPYETNVGYQARGLPALLYVLALREPGTLYFASQNTLDKAGFRRHYHVAAILPYFEESGEFRVAVFESAAETSIGAFIARGPLDFVHLVRVRIDAPFNPPDFPPR